MATYYIGGIPCTSELYHHGILGQKWGRRRYQNEDGSLTQLGRVHYGYNKAKTKEKLDSVKSKGPIDVKEAYGKASRSAALNLAANRAAFALPILGVAGGTAATLLGGPTLGTAGGYAGLALGTTAAGAIWDKTDKNYKKLLNETNPVKQNELRIKDGTEFKRTSLKESEDAKERLYVALSNAKYDVNYYSKTWPNYLKRICNDPNAKVYQNTYKVEGEIIAPSYQKRKEVAQAIISADRKMKTELGKAYAMDQLRLSTGNLGANTLKELEKKTGPWVKKRYEAYFDKIVKNADYSLINDDNFKQFTASIPKSGKLMSAYIKALKKEGYSAVFDDNSNSFAPFIVFDSSMLKQIGSKELK